jgi:hypothetical protein
MLMGWDYVWTATTNKPIVYPPDDIRGEPQWNDIDRGKIKELGEKPVPVPFYPPQIPRGLSRARTYPFRTLQGKMAIRWHRQILTSTFGLQVLSLNTSSHLIIE